MRNDIFFRAKKNTAKTRRIIIKNRIDTISYILILTSITLFFNIKIMPAKKTVKKVASKATVNVEKKAKFFAKSIEREAKIVKAEGKELGSKI
jgi:hypothetical protein